MISQFLLRSNFAGLVVLAMLSAQPPAGAADTSAAVARPKSPPTAVWARNQGFLQLRLSPDGKHLAAHLHDADGAGVAVLSLPDMKKVGGFRIEPGRALVDVEWSGNEFLVAALGTDVGPIESPAATGELISFRYDGREPMYVLGDKRRGQKGHQAVWAWIVDPLHDDPLHVLVITKRYDKARSEQSLQKLNIRTSHLVELAMAPTYGSADFVLDASHQVRYVNVNLETDLFRRQTWRREADGSWTPLSSENGLDAKPIALSRDGASLYRMTNRNGGPWCLDRVELVSNKAESLACNPRVDVLDTIAAFDNSREPIAALLEPGRSELRVFATGHPHRELFQLAVDAFPGKRVTVN